MEFDGRGKRLLCCDDVKRGNTVIMVIDSSRVAVGPNHLLRAPQSIGLRHSPMQIWTTNHEARSIHEHNKARPAFLKLSATLAALCRDATFWFRLIEILYKIERQIIHTRENRTNLHVYTRRTRTILKLKARLQLKKTKGEANREHFIIISTSQHALMRASKSES